MCRLCMWPLQSKAYRTLELMRIGCCVGRLVVLSSEDRAWACPEKGACGRPLRFKAVVKPSELLLPVLESLQHNVKDITLRRQLLRQTVRNRCFDIWTIDPALLHYQCQIVQTHQLM